MSGRRARSNGIDRSMTLVAPTPTGILDPRTGKPVGADDEFFVGVNNELADKGFVITAVDDLVVDVNAANDRFRHVRPISMLARRTQPERRSPRYRIGALERNRCCTYENNRYCAFFYHAREPPGGQRRGSLRRRDFKPFHYAKIEPVILMDTARALHLLQSLDALMQRGAIGPGH